MTTNLSERIVALGRSHFDLANSCYVSGNPTAIAKLERQLHLDFSPANIPCEKLTSGNTEVFHLDAWQGVLDEVQHKISKFPHLQLKLHEGIQIEPPKVKPVVAKPSSDGLQPRIEISGLREFLKVICEHADSAKLVYTPNGELQGLSVISQSPEIKEVLKFRPQVYVYAESKNAGRRRISNGWLIVPQMNGLVENGNHKMEFYLIESTHPSQQIDRLKAHIAGSIKKHAKGVVENEISDDWRDRFNEHTRSFLEGLAARDKADNGHVRERLPRH